MKCPYCDHEMEKGFLQTGGTEIIWDPKPHSFWFRPSKQGFMLAYRALGARTDAFHCKECQNILLHYEKEK